MTDLPTLREFLLRHDLLYDTPSVRTPICLIGWARDPAWKEDGHKRALQYVRDLRQKASRDRERRQIHDRLHNYIARGQRLTKEMFRQCRGVFAAIYELKTRNTRLFLFKWRCVWFLACGMDKDPNLRAAMEGMRQAERIRRDMETWLDEHAPE